MKTKMKANRVGAPYGNKNATRENHVIRTTVQFKCHPKQKRGWQLIAEKRKTTLSALIKKLLEAIK